MYTNGALNKQGGPPATTLLQNPLILGLSGRRWTEVDGGESSDPPTPFDKPWLLPQTTLHTHARRTFCTSVCQPKPNSLKLYSLYNILSIINYLLSSIQYILCIIYYILHIIHYCRDRLLLSPVTPTAVPHKKKKSTGKHLCGNAFSARGEWGGWMVCFGLRFEQKSYTTWWLVILCFSLEKRLKSVIGGDNCSGPR